MSFNPENVSYKPEAVAAAAAGSQLADGNYMFVVDSTKIVVDDKSGNIVAVNKVSPLDPEDGETRRKPAMYLRVTLPLNNDEVDGHEPPDWAAGITREFLQAVSPEEHPSAPRKDSSGNWTFAGDEIDASDVDAKKLESSDAVFQTSLAWAKNENLFKDNTFFGKVVTAPSSKDPNVQYTNIKGLKPEIPSGEVLTSLAEFKATGKLKVAEKAPGPKSHS